MNSYQGVERKPWSSPAVVRPHLYIILILAAMLATFVAHLRRDAIFACPAPDYAKGYYLAYCQAAAYADYEHGAYWFGLESEARQSVAAADVLFLGDSRLQFGFSTRALADWFAARSRTYHLLGFGYDENSNFAGALLNRLRPRARAYVISLDDFFVETLTPPARELLAKGTWDVQRSYEAKRIWQFAHRLICGSMPFLCGSSASFFRDSKTGAWLFAGVPPNLGYSREDVPADHEQVARGEPIGAKFIADLGVDRSCVFMTYIPTLRSELATAQALADKLGFEMVSPQLDGFETFDTSHLTPASAERFTSAVLERIGPRLAACLQADKPK